MARGLTRAAVLWCTAWAVFAVAVVADGIAADSPPQCSYGVTGPQTHPGTLSGKASFRCVIRYPRAKARVAIQKRVKGRWTTVKAVQRAIDITAGHTYTVEVTVPCRATRTFTGVAVRTLFNLWAHPGRLEIASAPENGLCRFG